MRRSALATLAICLTLGAPLLAFAPPAAVAATLRPSGPALLHVGGDGQTAIATKQDRRLFTVRVPADAVIDWVGLVEGKGDRSGTYTPSQLVKAWKALGHRAGVGVQSTITWFPKAGGDMDFRSVMVSDPRINSNGELVFTARVNEAARSGLPRTLPDFGINIARAAPSMRYPIVWDANAITTGLGYNVSVGGNQSGSVTYEYSSSYKPGDPPPPSESVNSYLIKDPVNCPQSGANVSFKNGQTGQVQTIPLPSNQAAFTCNNYTVNLTPATYVKYSVVARGVIANASVLVCWDVQWSGGFSTACSPILYTWSYG